MECIFTSILMIDTSDLKVCIFESVEITLSSVVN